MQSHMPAAESLKFVGSALPLCASLWSVGITNVRRTSWLLTRNSRDTRMSKADIGLIGLAVMGSNLALNIAEKGHTVAVHNRTASRIDEFVATARDEGLADNV